MNARQGIETIERTARRYHRREDRNPMNARQGIETRMAVRSAKIAPT